MGVLTKVWAGDREAAEMVSGVGFKPETLPPEGAREEREGRVTKGPLAKTWHCCREEPENDILASLCSHPHSLCPTAQPGPPPRVHALPQRPHLVKCLLSLS